MNTAVRRTGSAWASSHILLPVAVVIFAAVIAIDFVTTGQLVSTNPVPQFSGLYLVRTLVLLISAVLLVVAVVSMAQPAGTPRKEEPLVLDLKVVQISIPMPLILWATLVLTLSFALLLLFNPVWFTILSGEDWIIEMVSSLLLFFAAANFVILLLALRANRPGTPLYLIGVAFLAAVVFLIGMEEVSWFQRSFGIETPEAFGGNKQNELNLHNFASNEIEIAYYFAGFIWFVLFPFAYHHLPFLQKNSLASFFVPGMTVLFLSAPFVAFNYNLWNNATIQFAFFATGAILVYYTVRSLSQPTASPGRYVLAGLCLAYVVIQIICLSQGQYLLKGWEVTEYKESLIPLSFLVYSLGLVMRVEKRIGLNFVFVNFCVGLAFVGLRILQKLN